MSQETSIIINHNGFLVWGPKGPNKNKNFTLCMTMPQAAGKKLDFGYICLFYGQHFMFFTQKDVVFPKKHCKNSRKCL